MCKIKKIVAGLVAATTISALGVSVFAVDYNHYGFDFSIRNNSYQFSNAAEKQDDLNYAKARCKTGSVSTTNPVKLSVYTARIHAPDNLVSEVIYATEASETDTSVNYPIYYTITRKNGTKNFLCGASVNYEVTIGGTWDP